MPPFTITGYRIFKLEKKVPPFTITGYRIFKLEKKVPSFTITGYRIFKLYVPKPVITGYKTIHFGIGDIENIPEETNIEEALQKLSEPTVVKQNRVKDVFASLKQLQKNSKYYYEPPKLEEEVVDGVKEETTEEIEDEPIEETRESFTNRFDITKINTSATEDPLLSAIESLDDFEDEEKVHIDSDLNEVQNETIIDEAPIEMPLVKSIKRSKKSARKKK